MLSIREEAGMPDGTPSRRVQELLENGEWDAKHQESLRCLGLVNCAGFISGDSKRFCGKVKCVVAAHKKAKGMKPGWYITMSPSCYLVQPVLPIEANGGPIMSGGVALLSQTTPAFAMSKGQWHCVVEAWLESGNAVESLGSGDLDLGDDPNDHLEVGLDAPATDQAIDIDDDSKPPDERTADPISRLTVDTGADETDAAEEIVNLLCQVKHEVDRLKSHERVLEGRVETMQVEHDGLVGDLALRINLNQMLRHVQRVEVEAGLSAPDLQMAMTSRSRFLINKARCSG
jgi:hypothetical protein